MHARLELDLGVPSARMTLVCVECGQRHREDEPQAVVIASVTAAFLAAHATCSVAAATSALDR